MEEKIERAETGKVKGCIGRQKADNMTPCYWKMSSFITTICKSNECVADIRREFLLNKAFRERDIRDR